MVVNTPRDTCCLWLPKKQRYCQVAPLPGKEYCSIHLKDDNSISRRVNCPIDPSHCVYEKHLKRHLKRCPALKEKEKHTQPYFKSKLNSGHDEPLSHSFAIDEDKNPSCKANSSKTNFNSQDSVDHGEAASEAVSILKRKLSNMTSNQVSDILHRIHKAYQKYAQNYEPEPLKFKHDSQESTAGKAKHRLQNKALIRHLEDAGLLHSNHDYHNYDQVFDRVFVEFGAGKATLSWEVQKGVEGCGRFILVDRCNFRRKTDPHIQSMASNINRNNNSNNNDIQNNINNNNNNNEMENHVLRLNVDIVDLDLQQVPYPSCPHRISGEWPTVCIGKHLCGAATDLSLRCMTKAIPLSSSLSLSSDSSFSNSNPIPFYFEGVAIALCCHQRCDWNSYINKPFFIEMGFTPEEFDFISLLSSWAVAATGAKAYGNPDNSQESASEFDDLDPTRRARLGMECKRLIDVGRIKYLDQFGFKGKLVYYIDGWISPENVMLLAKRK